MPTDAHIDVRRTAEMLAAHGPGFAELSRRYAAAGDGRRAALAAWAADIRAVQSMVWEGAIAAGSEPTEALPALADLVATALPGGTGAPVRGSVRSLVEHARLALLALFDESVQPLLAERLMSLDHLDGVPAAAGGAANAAVLARLDGRTGEELAGDLLTTASDCRLVAAALRAQGDHDEEARQMAWSDLAAFEAYLVMSSAASGDVTLATADLRWELAASAWESARAHLSAREVRKAVREAISSVVLPAEQEALRRVLAAVSVAGDEE